MNYMIYWHHHAHPHNYCRTNNLWWRNLILLYVDWEGVVGFWLRAYSYPFQCSGMQPCLKRLCMVKIRHLQCPYSIYCETASEVRAELLWRMLSRNWVFVFIQDLPPSPTVKQSCQCGGIQSPLHCFKKLGGARWCGTELNLASASLVAP